MDSSQSHKQVRPLSAKKIPIQKPATRKKTSKIPDSAKLIKRNSPKLNSPRQELLQNKGSLTGRTLSSEFTAVPHESIKGLIKLEKEHNELLSLYNKMSDELLHLKTLEKLDKQREKQINNMKNKLVNFSKEKSEIQSNIKNSEILFKDFLKKMEKGFLSAEEKNIIAERIQEAFVGFSLRNNKKDAAEHEKLNQLNELWGILPRLEKVFKMFK